MTRTRVRGVRVMEDSVRLVTDQASLAPGTGDAPGRSDSAGGFGPAGVGPASGTGRPVSWGATCVPHEAQLPVAQPPGQVLQP